MSQKNKRKLWSAGQKSVFVGVPLPLSHVYYSVALSKVFGL